MYDDDDNNDENNNSFKSELIYKYLFYFRHTTPAASWCLLAAASHPPEVTNEKGTPSKEPWKGIQKRLLVRSNPSSLRFISKKAYRLRGLYTANFVRDTTSAMTQHLKLLPHIWVNYSISSIVS